MAAKRPQQRAAAGTLDGTEIVEIVQRSATVTITDTTISAAASDNSFNDSGNGFLAAGFAAGDGVQSQGFTGDTANNSDLPVIVSVTAGKMIVSGLTLVDDAAGESVTLTKLETKRSTVAAIAGEFALPPRALTIAVSDETTALTTGTAKITFRMPYAMTLDEVRASVSVAQATGTAVTVDINEGGTTILSTKLTIDNTEKTSTTATTPAVISDAALADDAEITVDIDALGDGTAKGLKITLIGSPV